MELKDIFNFYADWLDAIVSVEFDGYHYGCSVEEFLTGVPFKVLDYRVGDNKILQGVKLRITYGEDFFVEIDTNRGTLDVCDNFGNGLYGIVPPEAGACLTAYVAEYDV